VKGNGARQITSRRFYFCLEPTFGVLWYHKTSIR